MIVVFDAKCLLCNGWVQFLLQHDSKQTFKFASIQGKAGQEFLAAEGLDVDELQTLLLVDKGRAWQHTAAIFRVISALGGLWRLIWIAWLIPSFVRDPLYRLVARNRYWIFGRADTCLLPPSNYQSQFLD